MMILIDEAIMTVIFSDQNFLFLAEYLEYIQNFESS